MYKFAPEVNKENFTISFGMAKDIPLIRKYRTPKSEFDLLCQISDLYDRRLYGKDFYKKYTEVVGITPRATVTLLAKLSWKELLCGFEKKKVYQWCYTSNYRPMPIESRFKALSDNKAYVEQAISDRQDNLIPFILRMGMSPKQIKDSLSKFEWKTIINNSFTRNKLLSERQDWKPLLGVSSSVLKYENMHLDADSLVCISSWLTSEKKVSSLYCNRGWDRDVHAFRGTISDTVSMAKELGEDINPKWSTNRWSAEHERIRKIYNGKDFTDIEIKLGLYPKLPRELSLDGYTANLLTTPRRVADEGVDMGHCVAGYAYRCQKGKYIVYSITSPEGVRSTLGLQGNGFYDQHQMKYNRRPDAATLAFGEHVQKSVVNLTISEVK